MPTTFSLVVDRLALALVVGYPGILAYWLIIHLNIKRLRRLGKRGLWIGLLGWPITVLPILYFRRQLFSIRWNMPVAVIGAGYAALLMAFILFRQAGKDISAPTMVGTSEVEPQKNSQALIERGIYARTRNPLYLAHWLVLLWAAAASGYAANWVLLMLDCIALPIVVRAEERELLDRYGAEFAAYIRRVPRFFPSWRKVRLRDGGKIRQL
jgi:protein-S-isoprenylcysteine O-methyltransferase Ste14